jgi:hypothetical protein
MDLDSYPYLLRGGRNHRFTTETFSIHGAVSPDFGLGIKWGPIGTHPRVEG